MSPKELPLLRQKVRKQSYGQYHAEEKGSQMTLTSSLCLLCLKFSVLHQPTKKHSTVQQLGTLGVSRSNLLGWK